MTTSTTTTSTASLDGGGSTVNVALDRALKIVSGVAAVAVLGRLIYQQLNATHIPVVAKAAQAKLDATMARLKQAKVIAIMRSKNLERSLERAVELVDMGYKVWVCVCVCLCVCMR